MKWCRDGCSLHRNSTCVSGRARTFCRLISWWAIFSDRIQGSIKLMFSQKSDTLVSYVPSIVVYAFNMRHSYSTFRGADVVQDGGDLRPVNFEYNWNRPRTFQIDAGGVVGTPKFKGTGTRGYCVTLPRIVKLLTCSIDIADHIGIKMMAKACYDPGAAPQ